MKFIIEREEGDTLEINCDEFDYNNDSRVAKFYNLKDVGEMPPVHLLVGVISNVLNIYPA